MKKALVYSPYWDTEGGGEKYTASVCQFLLKNNYQVDIAWKSDSLIEKIYQRFNLNLGGVRLDPDAYQLIKNPGSWWRKWMLEKNYDISFWVSDGSIPWGLAKKNLLHFQVPFNFSQTNSITALKLKTYQAIICNSIFTKKIIDRTFGCRSLVFYPPVTQFEASTKRKMILSVGRFDSPSHHKRHDVLVHAFKELDLGDWELVIAGGLLKKTEAFQQLVEMADRDSITIIENPSYSVIKKLYGEACIYWHAAGFGEDLSKHPERAEHFGIATAEAMSAGAVPVVFEGGGQPEIVTEGINGCLWTNTQELIDKTMELTSNETRRAKLATRAQIDAQAYSQEAFERSFKKLIG